MTANHADRIPRYGAATRINHWIVAITFVLLALSGFALFHPALFWLTNLFGGGPWTRLLHPFMGCFLVAAFLALGLRVGRDNTFEQRDWAWLRRFNDVVQNREQNLPDVGRYNGGQKFLYFTIVLCLTLLFLSGLVIWREYFSAHVSVGVLRLGSLAHAFLAVVLTCAIVVHIYAALWVKGSIRAMTRGWVAPGWAWKHHRAWYREVTRNPQQR